jgi:type VI secretion system secreted protein VgrG
VIQGPQTAFVVGPGEQSGGGEEIWTDDYGRVLVRFHWERPRAGEPQPPAPPNDEVSCFVRVASAWAGKRWGLQFTPRVGMEVVVEFLEGDPDRPLVTGAVYNAVNRPPYPNTLKTRSGLRTHSTGGGTDPSNELRFEDKKGAEELFVFAARDQRVKVQADRHLTVGGAESVTVSGTRTTIVEKKDKLTLSDEQELTVTKRAVQTFAHGLEVNVTGADQVTYVALNRIEQVMKTLSLESPERICLSVGASTIVMTPTEIAFAAERITINGQMGVAVSGAAIKLNG